MQRWLFVLLLLIVPLGCFVNCTNTSKGVSPDPTQLHYPIGIAVHPSGKYLYVSNANFDLAYTGGTVMVLDTQENKTAIFDVDGVQTELKTLTLNKEATVEIGSFAGQIVVNQAGTKAYVAVRQDKKSNSPIDVSSIITLNIDTSKTGKGHLSCNEKTLSKDETGGVGTEEKFDLTPAPRCGDASKIFLEDNPFPYNLSILHQCVPKRTCTSDSNCTCSAADKAAGRCKENQVCLQSQCVDTCKQDSDCGEHAKCSSGKCQKSGQAGSLPLCHRQSDCSAWEECKEHRLLASHLQKGGLSEITLSTKKRRISGIDALPSGVTAFAILPPWTPLGGFGEIFLGSKQDNNVYVLPSSLPPSDVSPLKKIPLNHSTITSPVASDFRGMAVGYDKKNRRVRLYVALRTPSPAILVYNLQRNTKNEIIPQLITYIPVGADPAQIVYRTRSAPQSDLLYVVCSREGRIDVIDVETLQVVHQIKVGSQPNFMAIYEPQKGSTVQHRRAYVANFLTTTISIINLDTHQVIGMVSGIDTRPPLP